MKIAIAAAALAVSLAPLPSFADDLPTAVDWSGFYIGTAGGYGRISSVPDLDQMSGGFGGGQVGYNHQIVRIVLGVEVDGFSGSISGSQSYLGGWTVEDGKIDALVSARGRVGIALEQLMVYGTAGAAFARDKLSITGHRGIGFPGGPGTYVVKSTQWHNGYVIGGGLEYAFNRSWSGKVEYQFTHLAAETYFVGSNPWGDFDLATVRAGINYRF
ncbi:outer membrane immunogenic protein [Bradyrhizobium elkanii]|nr:outer membrane immunogenic protein [Bradyrhizobium elkanii]